MKTPPTLFDNAADAQAACAARNHAGGFYQVRDLVKEPHADFPGAIGFAVLWDSQAASEWRFGFLAKHFQRPGPVHLFHELT